MCNFWQEEKRKKREREQNESEAATASACGVGLPSVVPSHTGVAVEPFMLPKIPNIGISFEVRHVFGVSSFISRKYRIHMVYSILWNAYLQQAYLIPRAYNVFLEIT